MNSQSILLLGGLVFLQCLFQPQSFAGSCNVRDDFDRELSPTWEVSDPAIVTLVEGHLDIDFYGDPPEFHWALIDNCNYEDFIAAYSCRDLDYTRGKAFAFRATGADLVGYIVNLRSDPFNDVVLSKGIVGDSDPVILQQTPFTHDTGEWVDVEVLAKGADITVWVNGVLVIDYFDLDPYLDGQALLTINAGATRSAHAQYDDFFIRAIPPSSNFPPEKERKARRAD